RFGMTLLGRRRPIAWRAIGPVETQFGQMPAHPSQVPHHDTAVCQTQRYSFIVRTPRIAPNAPALLRQRQQALAGASVPDNGIRAARAGDEPSAIRAQSANVLLSFPWSAEIHHALARGDIPDFTDVFF